MKRPNITKGPWVVLDVYEATFHNESAGRVETVFEIQSREEGNTPAYATSDEHAKVIAAVPDMMDALEKTLAAMDEYSVLSDDFVGAREKIISALKIAGYTK